MKDKVKKDKKKAEGALKQAKIEADTEKVKIKAIISAIGDGICVIDTDFKILYENQIHIDLYGDHVGENCYKVFQNRDEVCEDCPVAISFNDGKVHTQEKRVQTEKGNVYVEITASPLKNGEGEIVAVTEVVRDITQRKEVEKELHESEERYRILFDSSPDAIFLANPETGRILDANPAASKLLQKPIEEIVGIHQSELHPPQKEDYSKETFKEHVEVTKKQKEVHPVENSVVRPDGTKVPVEVLAQRVNIGGRDVLQGVFRDITERKKAEEALHDSEERFRKIFEEGPLGIGITGLDFKLIKANPAWCKMLGYTEKELTKLSFPDITHPDDVGKDIESAKKLARGEIDTYKTEKRYIKKNKKPVWVAITASVIRDDAGKPLYYQSTLEDITERKEIEDSLKAIHEKLEERVNDRTKQLRLQQEINRAMNMGMSLKDVLQITVEGIRDVFDYHACDVFMLDGEGKNLILSAISVDSKILKSIEKVIGLPILGFRVPLFEGSHFTEVVMKKKFCIMEDTTKIFEDFTDDKKLRRLAGPVAKIAGFKSAMEVPLIVENEVIGAIGVSSKGRITKDDAEIIQRFASQIALTIRKRQLEEELRESEERYRGLVESARDVIFTISPDGTINSLNLAFEDITGFKREELIGASFLQLVHPDDHHIAMTRFKQSKKGKKHPTYELRFKTSQGGHITGEIRSTPQVKDGKVVNILGIVRDVTGRKRAEEEMKRRLMKFSLEDGNLYMVKEPSAGLSLRAFNDLLGISYHGLIISRDTREKFEKTANGDFEFLWLAEKSGKKPAPVKLKEIKQRIEDLPRKNAVLIDRLDYLIFKNGFEKTLSFVQHLRELAYLSGNIFILSIDPSTQDKRELRLLEKETLEIEPRIKAALPEDLLEILSFVYEQNAMGIKPSYTRIGKEVAASKPTVRKRIRGLISSDYVLESKKGLHKVVELTDKGRILFSG